MTTRALKTTRVSCKALNGDIYTARQDTFNDDIWYLEHYPKGQSKPSMKLCITDHNCTELFKLFKNQKPKTSYGSWIDGPGHGRRLNEINRTALAPIYKKIFQGRSARGD